MRYRILDLFCGAGGTAMGYRRAGLDVIGVDIKPQPRYPFDFIEGDALEVMHDWLNGVYDWPEIGEIDAIHASPPCQAYSILGNRTHNADSHPDLIGPTRELLEATRLPYVIENVVGAPLIDPVLLCGSSFGLGVRRHRLFETTFPVEPRPCAHHLQPKPVDVTGSGNYSARATGGGANKPRSVAHAREAMGIEWMSRRQLSQAIPPAYAEYVGKALIRHLITTSNQEVA